MVRHGIPKQRADPIKVERATRLRQQMTDAERVLWQSLRGNRLAGLHVYRQHVISGFIVDFYWPAALLVIEVDGDIHEQQGDYDAERDGILEALGLRVLRVTNDEVRRNLAKVLACIAAACGKGS